MNTKQEINSRIILAIFFLSCMSLGTSCCRKDKDKPTYYMDQEFKDYVVFPVGSYWVYQDSASAAEDSMYLYRQDISIVSSWHSDINYEKLFQHISSSYNTLYSPYTIEGVLDVSDKQGYEYYMGGTLLFFSMASLQKIGSLYYIAYYDSLPVKNVFYRNVKIFQYALDTLPYPAIKKIYWSRKTGIIKKEMYNGEVWELKKYHIN